MSSKLDTAGQRCISEPEPELGLGIVVNVEKHRLTVSFPASGEQRLYARDTEVVRRIVFQPGEQVSDNEGQSLVVESVEIEDGLSVYVGGGKKIREDQVSDIANFHAPQDRFIKAQVDRSSTFDLRYRTLQSKAKYQKSTLRGLLGGRVEMIPHQYYIVQEIAQRQNPRVLLSDEVGLGKTIEACLILQHLKSMGKVTRVLILVPEPLIHQWFVELYRRFQMWFSIYDEERCRVLEKQNIDGNPFRDESLILTSSSLLAESEVRSEQAIEADWDLVIIDEAHHLEWQEGKPSNEYQLAEGLAAKSEGLLLLTATPTQLGLEGHFARLKLLDPNRYNDFELFLKESKRFSTIANLSKHIIEDSSLSNEQETELKTLFGHSSEILEIHLRALKSNTPGSKEKLVKVLLDEYGTGRVLFRNTRDYIKGFPSRKLNTVPLGDSQDSHLNQRIQKEFIADTTGDESSIRYQFEKDPRLEWLIGFLRKNSSRKVLLICKSQRKVLAIKSVLDSQSLSFGVFHEKLTLIQRDRNAAWFAEPDGAQLLVCSEIGSEGRNFQFAHDLVLFDLPLDPGLLEQRIGRLDRIGQTETIQIHIPFVSGSAVDCMQQWYHQGLDAFEHTVKGSEAYLGKFSERVQELAKSYRKTTRKDPQPELDKLIQETKTFRKKLERELHEGRDRLLELNSFDEFKAQTILSKIREAESNVENKELLFDLLEHYGVGVSEHENGDFFLDSSHAFIDAFPSIPKDGCLANFERSRAVRREDVFFITQDHPIFQDAIDHFLASPAGSSTFATLVSEEVNLLLECIFVVEVIAESRWHVERFVPPEPLRTVVDVRGKNRSREFDWEANKTELKNGDIHRFLELPTFNLDILKNLIAGANRLTEKRLQKRIEEATNDAKAQLGYEYQRLVDLRKINDHVRLDEIEAMETQLRGTLEAIQQARLRLDSIRVVMTGPQEALDRVSV